MGDAFLLFHHRSSSEQKFFGPFGFSLLMVFSSLYKKPPLGLR